jgi:hypothetical protein
MSMVVDVTAIVLVLRVAVVDGECLTVVQHARQASEAPLAGVKLRMGRSHVGSRLCGPRPNAMNVQIHFSTINGGI